VNGFWYGIQQVARGAAIVGCTALLAILCYWALWFNDWFNNWVDRRTK